VRVSAATAASAALRKVSRTEAAAAFPDDLCGTPNSIPPPPSPQVQFGLLYLASEFTPPQLLGILCAILGVVWCAGRMNDDVDYRELSRIERELHSLDGELDRLLEAQGGDREGGGGHQKVD